MARKTGYLASVENVPPLIFRFQFNPELLSEKKSYKYKEANAFGKWGFDKTSAAKGLASTLGGLADDIKEIGSLLVATKPLEAEEGDQRTFAVDFHLDASRAGPLDGTDHYGGSIEPDLAVLRSFMNPSLDFIDLFKMTSGVPKEVAAWNKPPQCTLVYGGNSVTCVMTDLNIKVTAFQEDGSPLRADVSVTLKEQTLSFSPVTELFKRYYGVGRSYGREGIGQDFLAVTPILNLFA